MQVETDGKWLSILHSLGLQIEGHGKHEICPFCKRKGFRFDDLEGKGTWICKCDAGAGNGWGLIIKYFDLGGGNEGFKSAVKMVQEAEGKSGGFTKKQPQEKKLATKQYLRKIFNGANKQRNNDVVDHYLTNRGIKKRPDNQIWHSPVCWNSETKKNEHAMLSVWQMPDGQAVQIERVFLTPDGNKLDTVEVVKRMTSPLIMNTSGGCVRLFDLGESKVLGIGEGVEDTIAAAEVFNLPFWSTWTAGRLGEWIPPQVVIDQVDHIVIAGNNDDSFTGQAESYKLARRLKSISKRLDWKLDVSPYFPDKTGCDWNDVLNGLSDCRLKG